MEPTKTHFLLPGGLLNTQDETLISTLLGSCVSVCLYDQIKCCGGINHFMLPYWNGHGIASPKYGNIAMERLVQNLLQSGSQHKNLRAKLFGGASMLTETADSLNIGLRNSNFATEYLTNMDIPIIASSIGGFRGRKIIFNTYSGLVKMKYLRASN